MKRVLVVSDNNVLARAFQSVVEDQSLNKLAKFSYRYSFVNKSPDSMIELGFDAINLKNPSSIDAVCQNYDLIWSIHCKQIFDSEIVRRVQCVNLHPGFNPYNRGWYPQVFSIIKKEPVGATIHIMVSEVDAGPIIVQEKISVDSWDTSLDLYKKIQSVEIRLLQENLGKIINGDFETFGPNGFGSINSLKDFRELCALDLNAVGTLGDSIDLLRALSHGDFDNAYFIDDSGNKVFVKICLKRTI